MQNGTQRIVIHTGIKPDTVCKTTHNVSAEKKINKKKKPNFSERLLQNTAVACAILLGVLTLRNIDAPWSRAAVNGIESALTMRIDPDSTFGKLSFVRSIVPESTLVFLNIAGSGALEPVDGDVVHEFQNGQPWTVYSCEPGSSVRTALSGNVSTVMHMENGYWSVVIDHGKGIETIYSYVSAPLVDAGDTVSRGQQICTVAENELYYEYRLNGVSVEPGAGDDI